MTGKRKVFFLFELGFGALVTLGAAFEVLNLLVPTLFPALQENPLMRLHHENRVVFFWTLLSNLATIPIGGALARSAVRSLAGRPEPLRGTRTAVLGMAAIVVGAVLVSGRYLLWPLAGRIGTDVLATVFAMSLVSTWFGLGTSLALLGWGHRKLRLSGFDSASTAA